MALVGDSNSHDEEKHIRSRCSQTVAVADVVFFEVYTTEKFEHHPRHPTHIHVIPPIQGNDRGPRLTNIVPPASRQVECISGFHFDLNWMSSGRRI